MTDFISQSGRAHTNNWLKNGNFQRIPRSLCARSYNSLRLNEVRPAKTVAEALTPAEASQTVDTAEDTSFLANWTISGSEDGCGSIDLDPLNPRTGIRHRSFDSGKFARVSFFKKATITLEQEVEVINQFRGVPATTAFSAYRIDGEVKLDTEIDFGSETINGIPFFSSNVGAYRRITHEVEACPLGLTKIILRLKISGDRGESVGISGLSFALGAYALSLPYSEAAGDVLLPRGTVILWEGDSCPPGFREIENSEESFLYQTYSDPNVMNGGTQEYPDVRQRAINADPNNPLDTYENAFAIKEPAVSEFLGDNEHFAHQKTSLFGETADEFKSQGPDSVRRMRTVDFNDCGEPELPLVDSADSAWATTMIRRASLIAASASVDFGEAIPSIPVITNIRDIAAFKRQTVQNIVLPGGSNEESDPNSPPTGNDVWRNPHRHTFRSKGDPTLPPYFTVRFCEKI